ncbi:MAG: chromate transporter [Syntrophobacteraceae bacterium]
MSTKAICTKRREPLMIAEKEARVGLGLIARTFLGIGFASFSLAALGEAKGWMTKKRKWFTDDEYMQGLGLAQLMPGAPSVNLSSYLGYRLRGLPGAAVATICFLTPCFLLMLLLSHLYLKYGEVPVVSGLFHGLGALVVGLVFNTVLDLWRAGVKTIFTWLMALTGFVLVFWLKMGVITILLIAVGASVIIALLTHRFPALSRWTGRWSGLWRKSEISPNNFDDTAPGPTSAEAEVSAVKPGTQNATVRETKGTMLTHPHTVEYASTCGNAYQPLHWLSLARSLVFLSIILAVGLLLISQRPELMQMGSRFLRIGAVVFGSGYAMLPFIQDTVVNQFAWLTDQQFAVALALSLITPGPVTIISTFIGFKVAGVVGALVGMLSMYFPAWAMTAMVATPYAKAGRAGYFKQVIGCIVATFIGTLVVVVIKLTTDTLVDIPTMAMAIGALVVQRFIKIDTVWIVLGGAMVSLVVFR